MNVHTKRCGCGKVVQLPNLKAKAVFCEDCHRGRADAIELAWAVPANPIPATELVWMARAVPPILVDRSRLSALLDTLDWHVDATELPSV